MIYLLLVMAFAGGLSALVVNWRFLIVVCLVLLVTQGIYAFVQADLWNFARTFAAIVAFQFGYVLGGLALETWRPPSLDKVASPRRSFGGNKSSD